LLLLHQPLYVCSIDLILYYIPIYACRGCIDFAFLLYSCHHHHHNCNVLALHLLLVAIFVAVIDDDLSIYGALSIAADGSGTPSSSSTVTFRTTVAAIRVIFVVAVAAAATADLQQHLSIVDGLCHRHDDHTVDVDVDDIVESQQRNNKRSWHLYSDDDNGNDIDDGIVHKKYHQHPQWMIYHLGNITKDIPSGHVCRYHIGKNWRWRVIFYGGGHDSVDIVDGKFVCFTIKNHISQKVERCLILPPRGTKSCTCEQRDM